jgi:L-threonate 2-dehydrogenase
MMEKPTVGVIGLGAMGAGMAHTLVQRGYAVVACDARAGVADAFAAAHAGEGAGARAASSPAALAAQVQVVVSVVVNAAQTEDVLFGTNGAAAAMKPGSVFVMCSTVAPEWSRAMEARLEALGVHYIDAPISGGAAKAAAGEMTMMSSAKPAAYVAAGGALEGMAGKVYRLGDRAGLGSAVKVVNQLLAGVHIAAAAEAMAFGVRQGIAAADLYEVITHSAGNSWMFENRMAHVLNGTLAGKDDGQGNLRVNSAVDIFVKDLGLVHDAAHAMKFPLPLASAALQQFTAASAAGLGRQEDAAVISLFPKA